LDNCFDMLPFTGQFFSIRGIRKDSALGKNNILSNSADLRINLDLFSYSYHVHKLSIERYRDCPIRSHSENTYSCDHIDHGS